MNYAEIYKKKPHYTHDDKYDADWAVWKEGSNIYVRFDGTHSFKDVLMDLWFWQSNVAAFDGADWEAHTGFKKAYYSVRNEVLDKCYELYKDGDEFIVLGHSLGGAMALLSVEDIGWHFKKKVLCITWGAPRVAKDKKGRNAISAYMADGSYNFENGSDIVPKLPWWYQKSPKSTHIGKKYSNVKALKDMLLNGCAKYHCGYGDESIYVSFLSKEAQA